MINPNIYIILRIFTRFIKKKQQNMNKTDSQQSVCDLT